MESVAILSVEDTGKTPGGNVRDIKVERLGKVTIYKRGRVFYLYYRENGRSIRRPVNRDLAAARTLAGAFAAARGG